MVDTQGHSARAAARLLRRLARPVDGAWLAAFRVLYGALLCVSMLRFLLYGWVDRLFVAPAFHFKYWGWSWVEPLSGPAMHGLFWALAGLALCVAVGLWFRWTATAFALGLSYVQLIDVSTYLNHYYLAALLAWLLACSPAGRVMSIDALRAAPRESGARVAAGWLYMFRFQLALVYVFAGIAKMQGDWLLHAQPLRIWLSARVDLPFLGPLLRIDGVPMVMSWAGMLFDTTIVAWLCIARTRPYAYAVLVAFHVATGLLLPIGMFPLIMTASTLVFFAPDWPRRVLQRLRVLRRPRASEDARLVLARALPSVADARSPHAPGSGLGVALALSYCLIQLLLPLRCFAYGGEVLWHEQGMRLSWRVMVRAKGGTTTFFVHELRTGRRFQINPRDYLTEMQVSEMVSQPDLIVQLAHHIARDLAARGFGPVEVHADARASLNGRRSRPLIDPAVDLTRVQDSPLPAHFILPAPRELPPRTRAVP